MSLLSPLPGSSAPAYCDIVPLFSQSIAFNRTGAHLPNWKGLRPAFHQSRSRAGCRVHRAQGGMEEVCGGLVFCSTISLSCILSSVSVCLIVWCHLMAVETFCRKWVFCFPSIHFSISMQEFLLIVREEENQQQSHSFESCHICVPSLFKFCLFDSFCGRQNLKGAISLTKTIPPCVHFNELATLIRLVVSVEWQSDMQICSHAGERRPEMVHFNRYWKYYWLSWNANPAKGIGLIPVIIPSGVI